MPDMRDYGLGDPHATKGPPRIKRLITEPVDGEKPFCPNCKCETLCEIEVEVTPKSTAGVMIKLVGNGIGTYLSCPACPWASPMAIVSRPDPKRSEN